MIRTALHRSLAVLMAVCLPLSCACVSATHLRDDFYQAAPQPHKVTAKVALVVNQAMREQLYKPGLDRRVYTGPALPDAVQHMLGSLYSDVGTVASPAEAPNADFLVVISTDFPDAIRLTFYEGASHRAVAWYSAPVDPQPKTEPTPLWVYPVAAIAILAVFPIVLAVLWSPSIARDNEAWAGRFGQQVAYAIAAIGEKIVEEGRVNTAGNRRIVAQAISRGNELARSGDFREALREFSNGLAATWLLSHDGAKLQARMFDAIHKMDRLPPLPEEAREHLAKGKALIKEAQSPSDYALGAEEMRQVVLAAPWWPSGYSNLALVEAGAGDYPSAIRDLKTYLKAAPDAPDAESAREKVAEYEVKLSKAGLSNKPSEGGKNALSPD